MTNTARKPLPTALSTAELLEFCNAVRNAGGAEEIDHLEPGDLGRPNTCLIARNLNFHCAVIQKSLPNSTKSVIAMISRDPRLAKIAKTMDLPTFEQRSYDDSVSTYMVLPDRVAASVKAFDRRLYPEELYRDHPKIRGLGFR
jgi:hypothetical protein